MTSFFHLSGMSYKSLSQCIEELDKKDQIVNIHKEVDPNLEMSSIHLKEFERGGKAVFFKNIKGSKYPAVSNLFGTLHRSRFIFRDSLEIVKQLIEIKTNPLSALKNPVRSLITLLNGIYSIPKRVSFPSSFKEIEINDLPQIRSWKKDGGAFITLPQVYSEDIDNPGINNSNLGMYRIQLSGNDYILNEEVGMHYQIHRGIGVHQYKANKKGEPLKVSVFVGGPPSHTFSAVVPLPEGMSEISFAGLLGKRRFRYAKKDGYTISTEADFVICGELHPNELKPEGPFGDHLGYYSLKHNFPVMRVKKVYAKDTSIWPFTVVGRPPQEDSQFGALIHEITSTVITNEIPGLKEVNAVDAAGVHPLLLAIGRERYTPYNSIEKPQELLTIANHILGTGQLSLAKYLFICHEENGIRSNNEREFFSHFFERVDWKRDLHFQTKTTIDTLDYSGEALNEGSKVVIAAAGNKKRVLIDSLPHLDLPFGFSKFSFISIGNLIIQGSGEIEDLISSLEEQDLSGTALITLVDDVEFVSQDFSNWLWVTFTRSNPAIDIYGLNSEVINKHFSCKVPIIDARIKPHHAPVLQR